MDDLTVMCTNVTSNSWVFTTLQSPDDFQHPVSGNMEFGLTNNGDGSYTFYARGADRLTGMFDVTVNYTLADIFQEGSTCWENMLDNLKIYVYNVSIG